MFFPPAYFLGERWHQDPGCSCRRGPAALPAELSGALQCHAASCWTLLLPATSIHALLGHATSCNALQRPDMTWTTTTTIWSHCSIINVTIIATVHRIPNRHRQTPPTKSLGLSEVSSQEGVFPRHCRTACSWGNYCNCWGFVNYRVWSRPTLSVKCLEITLVMIWYYK